MAFAFKGSSSWNGSSGSPRKLLGKRRRSCLLSRLRQNRILALFATHVVRTGLVLSPPSPASDQEIGRASCRERGEISVVAVSLKKKSELLRYGTHHWERD